METIKTLSKKFTDLNKQYKTLSNKQDKSRCDNEIDLLGAEMNEIQDKMTVLATKMEKL